MNTLPDRNPTITDPLTPAVEDGLVVIVDPPETAMEMTADAAEISGIRLLDAAAKAREPS